jgi:hypothetical protein
MRLEDARWGWVSAALERRANGSVQILVGDADRAGIAQRS